MTRLSDRARIASVEFRVLGPLSAFLEGEPRKLGGRRQRMVLAVLLSRPNEVVSQDELIEAVWSGFAPESAIPTLHSYVSNLRKILGGTIDRNGDGYVVVLATNQLDSVRFEELVSAARRASSESPADTLAAAIEALGMWHGRAYGDLGSEPALINESIRLDEARLATLELRTEADIALGNHAAVVQELEALTKEHPFREKLWGFLMVSLYRSGRQADALRAYQDVRKFLGDELGIDPSSELQALEERILTHDPDLELVTASMSVDRAARGYELREKYGESPYGVLYQGFQGSVGREVSVLKLDDSISSSPSFVRRFESEMRGVSELEHPHLVTIYDFWRDPDGAYLVTALPRGGTLREVLANDAWNLSSMMRTVDQLGSVLSYLHRNGFVHGALTLDSVLLDDESNAYISDLGLAGLKPDSDRRVSPSDDVSALATIAIALLTGDQTGSVTRPGASRPDLTELDDLFARALHPDPASRFEKPEDLSRALRRAIGTDVVASVSETPTGSRRNPYKGLRAFKESEAGDFHGRDSLVEDLVESLASRRLVAVVGPSGSGKSSLVRAGLLPAVRSGSIVGSQNWLIAEMFPGTHPFEELEAALIRVATDRPPGLIDELTSDDRGLARAAKKIIGNDQAELVILIDQFEELFSLVSSETNRRLFLDSLAAAAGDERSRLRFVLTLRADFFDQPLQYPDFAEVMNEGLVPISPPSEEGLTRAIAQPARGIGVDLQPGLVTRIIDDVRDEPGGLPLMQYALTELFNKRENNTMTLAAYEESGGVAAALANRADEIYDDLSSEGKVAARNLFLRLVNVDEMADDTRRRVRQTELKGLSLDQTILDDVIQQFGAFRLLSFDRDAVTRTPTVEVAHEALIREWDRLRSWIDDRREDLLIHRRMQVTARDWGDAEKDPSYLLRGSRLEQALVWQERTDIAITDGEMTFIEASIEQEKRDLAERAALEAKSARGRKAVIGTLAGGLVVAGLLGVIALDRAGDAELATIDARARELAVLAADTTDDDPERGMLVAMESIELSRDAGLEPLPEALGALQLATQKSRVVARFPDALGAVAVSPDGTMIATDSVENPGSVNLWNVATREKTRTLAAPLSSDSFVEVDLKFSPDGKRLAIGRYVAPRVDVATGETQQRGGLEVFDFEKDQSTSLVDPGSGSAFSISFSSDGRYLAALTDSGLLVWDDQLALTEGFARSPLRIGRGLSIGFVGESSEVAVPLLGESRVVLIDAVSGNETRSLSTDGVDPEFVEVDPTGSRILVSNFEMGVVKIFDLSTSDSIDIDSISRQTLGWNQNGSALAVSGNGAVIEVFDAKTGRLDMSLSTHKSSVYALQFSADGEFLFSVSLDGEAVQWSVTGDGPDDNGALLADGGFLRTEPSGAKGFLLQFDHAKIFDLRTGEVLFRADVEFGIPDQAVTNESFSLVGGFDPESNRHAVWETATNGIVATYDECTVPKAISPDGELIVLTVPVERPGCGPAESRIENLATGQVWLPLPEVLINTAEFSPAAMFDGELYLAINRNTHHDVVDVYSITRREHVARLDETTFPNLADVTFLTPMFSSDGRYLGLGMNVGLVAAANMEDLVAGLSPAESLAINQIGHDGNAARPSISSSGIMATTAFDKWVRLWDLSSQRKLVEFQTGSDFRVAFVAFAADEEMLLYTDMHGVIRSYPLDVEVLLARAEAVLTRTLTDDECTQFLHTDGCEA